MKFSPYHNFEPFKKVEIKKNSSKFSTIHSQLNQI